MVPVVVENMCQDIVIEVHRADLQQMVFLADHRQGLRVAKANSWTKLLHLRLSPGSAHIIAVPHMVFCDLWDTNLEYRTSIIQGEKLNF